ncbi:MAG: flagellar hook-associated protein FlgK [Planctomycetes bacterium]|nr:flagellar hook-associated protein FlgK [Planctomycetota bacterium]
MGLLNSALHIGRTALLGYQGALQVIGNNISSAGTENYTRLSPQLSPLQGDTLTGNLKPGAGVALSGIQRNIDEALESRVRLAIGSVQANDAQRAALLRIEQTFSDLSGADIGSRLTNFFNSFEDLQNRPDDTATRELVLAAGTQLAGALLTARTALIDVGDDIDGQIVGLVESADNIAGRIARLNEEITVAEAGTRSQATGLRDQRDTLLRELSQIFDVTVREQPNGALNVYIGSEALIQGNFVRGLIAVTQSDGTFNHTTARFADTNQQIDITGGQLAGLISSRDVHAFGRIDSIDQLAAAIIAEVNRVHADGQGFVGYESLTGAVNVLATNAGLTDPATGLASAVQDGSFYITVIDELTKTPVAFQINVVVGSPGGNTTLESLVSDINAQVEGLTASVTSDNRIAFEADDGLSFVFGYDGQQARTDSSGVLTALGVNTFFTGSDARNMAVNQTILEQSLLIAASAVSLPGEGSNAGRIAGIDIVGSASLGGSTIPDFYRSIVNAVAVTTRASIEAEESSSAILASLNAQKGSISGVNLDEEAISLLKFERAFQGASRYISSVSRMLDELILLIR